MSVIRLFFLLASLVLSGCASTHNNPKDPLESFNRGVYQFNDALDKAVVKPVAKGYDAVMPPPGKMMVSNFFSNLNDVAVTVNDLLQFKLANAASDTGRILINSTIGLLGLVDVASQAGLEKHNEDFGQTLGYWGVGSGPYLMLPFFGPSSVRDGLGLYADSRTDVFRKIDNVPTRNELHLANLVSKRASLLNQEKVLDEAMIDPYSYIRDAYLQHRRNLIYDNNPPREKLDDDENGSIPNKTSANDNDEGIQPVVAATTAVAAPGITSAVEPSAGIYRVWLPQTDGMR